MVNLAIMADWSPLNLDVTLDAFLKANRDESNSRSYVGRERAPVRPPHGRTIKYHHGPLVSFSRRGTTDEWWHPWLRCVLPSAL